jgi:hypothetical protein
MNCAVRNSQIADRLPFTGDTLVSSKIGKIVRKLAKDAPIPGECSFLFKRYLSSCSAKTGFPCVDCHLCTNRNNAPFDFFVNAPQKGRGDLTIRIHAIYFTAVKDMATNLERKWRNQFVFMQDQVIPADDDAQGGYYYYWLGVGPLLSSRHETKETQAS